ncbi:MAG: hypothetical protein GXP05_14050 [Alphaproteobacteria bacterium]|nr:hypothetical protein [Alphaproteobacteria bacterium]
MRQLIEKGLMFSNLFEVRSAALVERYGRALKHLTGRETALTDFHIDISGYSPEIGDELGDDTYLNPNGCNRQFILLSTKQKSAPLLNGTFSTSYGILRQFIDENEAQIFALTARDAVAGELVNSVMSVTDPARLFKIRKVEIEADTTQNHVADAAELMKKIEQFQTRNDAWWDDDLIGEMIGLARVSGDITRNPVSLKNSSFRQDNFYTSHFGGIYIFRDVSAPAAIRVASKGDESALPIATVYQFGDRDGMAQFLAKNHLVESIVSARNLNAAALLRQRLDFILVDTAASAGEDLAGMTRMELRRAARRHLEALPPEYQALSDLLRSLKDGSDWPEIAAEHPAYFYTLRAAQTKDRDLVNMLLAELSPMDVRQLFICHKQAFYRAYRGWSDVKKSYVANFLAEEYSVDKAGARAALFGPEPGMEDVSPEPAPAPRSRARRAAEIPRVAPEEIIRRVGPWGAVGRSS